MALGGGAAPAPWPDEEPAVSAATVLLLPPASSPPPSVSISSRKAWEKGKGEKGGRRGSREGKRGWISRGQIGVWKGDAAKYDDTAAVYGLGQRLSNLAPHIEIVLRLPHPAHQTGARRISFDSDDSEPSRGAPTSQRQFPAFIPAEYTLRLPFSLAPPLSLGVLCTRVDCDSGWICGMGCDRQGAQKGRTLPRWDKISLFSLLHRPLRAPCGPS